MGGWGEEGDRLQTWDVVAGYLHIIPTGRVRPLHIVLLFVGHACFASLPSPGQTAIHGDACWGKCLLFFFFLLQSLPLGAHAALRAAHAPVAMIRRKQESRGGGRTWINDDSRPHCLGACEIVPLANRRLGLGIG